MVLQHSKIAKGFEALELIIIIMADNYFKVSFAIISTTKTMMFRAAATAMTMKLAGKNFIMEQNFVNSQLVIDNRFAFSSIIRDTRRILVAR
jgi:hypothetical protein